MRALRFHSTATSRLPNAVTSHRTPKLARASKAIQEKQTPAVFGCGRVEEFVIS
jgi:hypothetical protein